MGRQRQVGRDTGTDPMDTTTVVTTVTTKTATVTTATTTAATRIWRIDKALQQFLFLFLFVFVFVLTSEGNIVQGVSLSCSHIRMTRDFKRSRKMRDVVDNVTS